LRGSRGGWMKMGSNSDMGDELTDYLYSISSPFVQPRRARKHADGD
jgi:hypothetical protein